MKMAQELIISTADLAVMIADLQGKANDLVEQAGRAVIEERAHYENGADFLKIVSGITKRLEDKRKGLVDDYGKRMRTINGSFKPVRDTLTRAGDAVKKKMGVWHNAEEKRQREIQQQQQREAEEAALLAAEKAEKAGDAATSEAILNMASEVEQPPAKPDIGRGSLTGAAAVATKVWTGEVIDMKLVCKAIAESRLPADLVVIPTSKLNELARAWHAKDPELEELQMYGILVKSTTRMSVR